VPDDKYKLPDELRDFLNSPWGWAYDHVTHAKSRDTDALIERLRDEVRKEVRDEIIDIALKVGGVYLLMEILEGS
jgi:hypothetical protein